VSPLWLWRLCSVLPKPIGIIVVLAWLLFLLCVAIFALPGVLDGTKYDDPADSTTQALDHMLENDVLATYLKASGR
jgi:hypothetical protein